MCLVTVIKYTCSKVLNHVNSHQLTRMDGTLGILDVILSMSSLRVDGEVGLTTFLLLLLVILWPEAKLINLLIFVESLISFLPKWNYLLSFKQENWSGIHVAEEWANLMKRKEQECENREELIINLPFDGCCTQVGWNAKQCGIFRDVFDFIFASYRVCFFQDRNLDGWLWQAVAIHNDIWGQIICLFHVNINISH